MASSSAKELSDQPLKYKTWVLKVSIHCEGCKRKVKKVLHKINGVYTISIDSQQQRVTVTGNVDVQTLINKLTKTGKHAQIWPENLTKPKSKAKQKDPQSVTTNTNNNNNNIYKNNNFSSTKMESQASASATTTEGRSVPNESETVKAKARHKSQRSKERETSPVSEKSCVGEYPGETEGEGGGSKKKKMKGQKGNIGTENAGAGNYGGPASRGVQPHNHYHLGHNEGVNLNQTRQSYWYPYNYPHQYGTYSNIWPSKTPSSWPYTCQQEMYSHGGVQGTPLGSTFEIFSDENVNGCFIM